MRRKRSPRKQRLLSNRGLAASLRNLDPTFGAVASQRLIKRNVGLASRLFKRLKRWSPNSSDRLIAGVAVDLADIWMIGEGHKKQLKEILRLRFPKDRERMLSLLARLEVNLLFENQGHLTSLRELLPKLAKEVSGHGVARLHRPRPRFPST